MAVEIIMPKNSMTMEEGKIIRWLKETGDAVAFEEPIMEIETEKISMECEAPASGILLAKYYGDGDTVPVLTVLGYISQAGEKVPEKTSGASRKNTQEQASAAADMGPHKEKIDFGTVQKNTEKYDFDIAFIGGGPAGYSGAIKAARLGAKTILFERDKLGGTCLNRDCIPAKAYLKSAECLLSIRKSGDLGIDLKGEAEANLSKIYQRKENVIQNLRNSVARLMKSNSVTVINADAALGGNHEINAGGTLYSAGKIILCSGSRPGLPPIKGIEHPDVLTSDAILEMREMPERLCIIGGGIIGCELGCAFRAFGSAVIILEALPHILPGMDDSVVNAIGKSLTGLGIDIKTGIKVQRIEDMDGKPSVVTESGAFPCDKVLIATGRVPDLSCLGILKDKIKPDRAFVAVNDRMETSINGIYAAEDVNGKLMLAHAASRMAEIAAENALGADRACNLKDTPSCLYTIPEAACVGLTETEAREQYGNDIVTGQAAFSANARALASGEPEGFVRVIAGKQYGELLGVHITGTAATEMIALPAALMSCEITVYEVVNDIIHAHPAYGEVFLEACAAALRTVL